MSDAPPSVRFDWQWPAAVVYAVAFVVLGVLVGLGKLHPEALLAMATWLAPGPYQAARTALTNTSTVHTETTRTVVTAPPPSPASAPTPIPVSVDDEAKE